MSGPPPQDTRPPRPGTVRWLRNILLGLGVLSLLGLGIPVMSIGSLPPVGDPTSAMSYVLALGLILGCRGGPSRRAVHLAIVLIGIATLLGAVFFHDRKRLLVLDGTASVGMPRAGGPASAST